MDHIFFTSQKNLLCIILALQIRQEVAHRLFIDIAQNEKYK